MISPTSVQFNWRNRGSKSHTFKSDAQTLSGSPVHQMRATGEDQEALRNDLLLASVFFHVTKLAIAEL